MLKKPRFPTYNHGVLWICEKENDASDFGAGKNAKKPWDVRRILKLDFEEKSKREEDMAFAESAGRTLSTKVRCQYRPEITPSKKVMIGKVLYSIIRVDHDSDRRNAYVLLEEERKL